MRHFSRETEPESPRSAHTSGVGINPLLEQAQAGDRRALDRLLAEARPRALAVALKVLRRPEDAEDAVQEAFLKAWRYLGRFEGRASFSTWLHRIVMNACLDLRRRQACRPETVPDVDDEARPLTVEPSHDETPERSLGTAQTGQVVRAAIERLSAPHRQTLALRELEEHSYEEIARASRCPVGTVMSRLHHARRRLSDDLRTRLGEEAPALCAA